MDVAASSPGLDALFRPRSIAVIGASEDASKFGGRTFRYLRDRFAGDVFPIHPRLAQIDGARVFAGVSALPTPPDLAVVCVPVTAVLAEVQACAAAGVRSAVVYTSGFAETGAQGAQLQQELAALAQRAGMRVLGPNCLGFFNVEASIYATFSTVFSHGWPKPGGIGIVSQSGAIGVHLYSLARDRGLGFSFMIATGNECNVGLGECLRYLVEDEQTTTLVAYLEGCRDPQQLVAGLEAARRRRKPVIALKVGGSAAGAQAALSHTGALAGSDRVFDAIFAEYGVHRARSFDEMVDVAEACEPRVFPRSHRVGVATVSGGAGILMADTAVALGLELPTLNEAAQQRLRAAAPMAAVANPIDTTAAVLTQMKLLRQFIDEILADPAIDTAFFFLSMIGRSPELRPLLVQALQGMREQHPAKLVALALSATDELRRDFRSAGCLVFEDPSRAIHAVAALVRFGRNFEAPARTRLELPPLRLAGNLEGELAALRALATAGVEVVPTRLVHSAREAMDAAAGFGFPVVMKLASPDVAHKSDIGGVVLGVQDREEAGQVHEDLLAGARARLPRARIEGVIVCPQLRGGVETILGGHVDPTFGPMVMFGLGGVFVEIQADVSWRRAPVDETEALAMIRELRGFALLAGARGRPGADLQALARALATVSRVIASNADRIASVEVNPFIALPRGGMAVDALIVSRPSSSEVPVPG